mgnify:CR=1 FL=1|tara:strand:- start:5456 stop:6415 length:960 start_codon:yes stop_codon:yes gene_type:complete
MNNTREEWLRERKRGLGGTDVACIICSSAEKSQKLGCFEKSAFSLWADKVGIEAPSENRDMQAAERGIIMEKYVVEMYENRLGKGAELVDSGLLWHPGNDKIFGTPDRLVKLNGTTFGMDAKTRRFRKGWGDDGGTDVPLDVEIQMRVYMEITDAPYWDIATYFGLDDFRVYRIDRDKALGKRILDIATEWWDEHVVGHKPPPPDGSDDARRLLSVLYNKPDVELLKEASLKDKQLREELLEVKKQYNELAARKKEIENEIRFSIGEAIGIEGVATWKPNKPSKVFDKNKFREENPEMYDKYVKEKPGSRVLRIIGTNK